MTFEVIIGYLFTIALSAFLLRWIVNWILLNRINKTNYTLFRANYSFSDYIPLIKHVAISEWKIWWKGNDYRDLKLFSNIISIILYLSIVLIISLLLIK